MKLPNAITLTLKLLEEAGYEAVVVGGAVRDYLLGLSPNDYDVSTNARPEEIKKVFQKYYMLEIGIKHGTITVFINGRQVEITSYRSEKDYQDFRHPKEVVFENSLREDLKRRDFTINAICYNRFLIDHVNGLQDLNAKVIRAIGDARERFSEDPLRILRALRFASTLDFSIESQTRSAIFSEAELLKEISAERINLELSKLLLGKAVVKVFTEYQKIFQVFIPELETNLQKNLRILETCDTLIERLAALLLGIDSDIVGLILRRLKYPKQQIQKISFLHKNYQLNLEPELNKIGKLLKIFDLKDLLLLTNFQLQIAKANNIDQQNILNVQGVLKNLDPNKCYRLKDLAVSGRDLLKLGYSQGVGIRLLLDELLDLVIEGTVTNEKSSLINYLEKHYPNQKTPHEKP